MLTYLAINLVFVAFVVIVMRRLGVLKFDRTLWIVLAILLVCTAVFDSLIIAADIVRYDHNLNIGLIVGRAPVEDFFYSLIAALIVPGAWRYLESRSRHG